MRETGCGSMRAAAIGRLNELMGSYKKRLRQGARRVELADIAMEMARIESWLVEIEFREVGHEG